MKKNLFLQSFWKGAKGFSQNIALIISSLLLSFVYLLSIGPTFLFAKIFKKHFLEKKPSKEAKTYWSDLSLKKKPLEEYYRQF